MRGKALVTHITHVVTPCELMKWCRGHVIKHSCQLEFKCINHKFKLFMIASIFTSSEQQDHTPVAQLRTQLVY